MDLPDGSTRPISQPELGGGEYNVGDPYLELVNNGMPTWGVLSPVPEYIKHCQLNPKLVRHLITFRPLDADTIATMETVELWAFSFFRWVMSPQYMEYHFGELLYFGDLGLLGAVADDFVVGLLNQSDGGLFRSCSECIRAAAAATGECDICEIRYVIFS